METILATGIGALAVASVYIAGYKKGKSDRIGPSRNPRAGSSTRSGLEASPRAETASGSPRAHSDCFVRGQERNAQKTPDE